MEDHHAGAWWGRRRMRRYAASGALGATAQPDLSSIGGMQANEAAQAGAKKAAENWWRRPARNL